MAQTAVALALKYKDSNYATDTSNSTQQSVRDLPALWALISSL